MGENDDVMGKVDRAELILRYLAENDVALPPKLLHDQLVLFRNATFSVDTVRRRLEDFQDAGYVEVVNRGTPLYQITGEGREALRTGEFTQIFED